MSFDENKDLVLESEIETSMANPRSKKYERQTENNTILRSFIRIVADSKDELWNNNVGPTIMLVCEEEEIGKPQNEDLNHMEFFDIERLEEIDDLGKEFVKYGWKTLCAGQSIN